VSLHATTGDGPPPAHRAVRVSTRSDARRPVARIPADTARDLPEWKVMHALQGSTMSSTDRSEDEDHPVYTMGSAAELIGVTPAFLRAVGEAGLITPLRSGGGHRRYSRDQLRLASRARDLVDQGTPVEAACRIVSLEDSLDEALRINAELQGSAPQDA